MMINLDKVEKSNLDKFFSEVLSIKKSLNSQRAKQVNETVRKLNTIRDEVESKASKLINKDTISQGLVVTSKGLDSAAQGAKSIAKTMEKASNSIKEASQKLKK